MGQTVNLLVFTFGGSNPSLPTIKECRLELFSSPQQGGVLAGRLYVVDSGWCAPMRYVFAEVAQLIEH